MEKRIVLIHGWGARAGKLEALSLKLEALGWEVLNLDMPGFGLADPPTAWGVGEYGDWVLGQIDKKWKRGTYAIFGHSFGGRVAIKLAALGKVDKVVLCAPGGLSRSGVVKRLIFKGLASLGKKMGLEQQKGFLYKLAREHDYEKTSGIMREVFKKVINEDLNPLAKGIKVPTLVLWGKQDRMVPYTDGQKFVQAKLVLFDNQGHRVPYELPEEVAKEINIWFGSL